MNRVNEQRSAIVLLAVFLFGIFVGSCCRGNDLNAAVEDRAKFPKEAWPNLYYFSLATIPEEHREATLASLCYSIASSSKTKIIEDCLPVPVSVTLYRIEIHLLNWDRQAISKVFGRTPYKRYHHDNGPLVNHPSWFITNIADSTESQAYNLLLYGKENPSERDFLKLTDTNVSTEIRKLEGQSGVASNTERDRVLRFFDNGRFTITTITDDFFRLGANKSLLLLKPKTEPDGKEGITGLVKTSAKTGDRGWLMATWQGNGKGEFAAEVPQRLATQKRGWRGHSAIVGPGGCWKCHDQGYKPMTQDLFRHYLDNAQVSTTFKNSKNLREQYLESVNQLIEDENKRYEMGVKMCTGYYIKEFLPLYEQAISWYDNDVSLKQAASELYTTPEELRGALGLASHADKLLHPELALLATQPISRRAWEDLYTTAALYLDAWRKF